MLSLAILSMQQKRYFEETFHLGSSILRRQVGVVGPVAARWQDSGAFQPSAQALHDRRNAVPTDVIGR